MTPPEGVKCKPNMVCLLKKSLYGLKQSPRCWNCKFDKFIKLFRLLPSGEDPCLYVGNIKDSKVYLILFVDDGLIAAPNEEYCSTIVKQLRNNFKITVSKIEYFIGMEIKYNKTKGTVFINQHNYIKQVINRFNMEKANPSSIPADPHVHLTKSSE